MPQPIHTDVTVDLPVELRSLALPPAAAAPPGLPPLWARLLQEPASAVGRLLRDMSIAFGCSGLALAAAPTRPLLALVLAYPLVVIALLAARGVYRERVRAAALDRLSTTGGACASGAVAVLALLALLGTTSALTTWVLVDCGLTAVGLVLSSAVAAAGQRAVRRVTHGQRVLIVGAGDVGVDIAERLEEFPEYGLQPVGFVDGDATGVSPSSLPLLGGLADLERVVDLHGIRRVLVAFSAVPEHQHADIIRRCRDLGAEVWLVPRLFDRVNRYAEVEHIGGLPLLRTGPIDPNGWRLRFKHGLDRLVAAVMLALLAPLMLAIAAGVRWGSPGPVLFRQRRVGMGGQEFELLKFRSMSVAPAEAAAAWLYAGLAPGGVEGLDRRTAFGRFLRRTSLDELPQLINVLRGEMSLVGPRPERPELSARFAELLRYRDRERVRPGMTGWSQVHGYRGQTSLARRIEWDNFYIDNWSLRLDLKILLLTFVAVLRGQGE